MFTIFYSTHFFVIIIVIILIVLPSSNGIDGRYNTCASTSISCGNIFSNVGYPFWGDGRPQYCGHPALQLQCLYDEKGYKPTLRIGQGDKSLYYVTNMQISNSGITLVLKGFQEIPCLFDIKGISGVFNFSPSVEVITFLYDCPRDIDQRDIHGSIPCSSPSTEKNAYYLYNVSARNKYASCSSFEVPVVREQLDAYNEGSYGPLINQSFEVNYEYSRECRSCMNSDGICGSTQDSDFVCLLNQKHGKWKFSLGLVSLTVGIGIMVIVTIACLGTRRTTSKFADFWKSEAAKCPNVDAFLQIYGSFALTRYTHANIKKMTNNFKDKLGEGGFAIVYKGKLLSGRSVAVKVLKQSKGDGDDFVNEVASISRTNHVNIVTLLGFCFEGNKRALIYEFLPNGSLEKYTYHGGTATNQSLPWETLLNIAVGIAKGLDYLHRGCNARILHFDIKPHNILLDEEFCPKISDFGLARLCPLQESTISMLEARGTIGYIAPEVFCRTIGGVSHKSDVYSFGMMVLDMVCGRKNLAADPQRSSEIYFPQWIYDRLEVEEEDAFDGITNDEEKAIQRKMILVSLWCIQTYPSNRPSMSRVVEMLQGCLALIELPPKPYLSSPPRLALDTLSSLTVITEISG